MDLLMKQDVSVRHDYDTVVLTIGRVSMHISYTSAIMISQALRVAANHTFAVSGVKRAERLELKKKASLDLDIPQTRKDSEIGVQTAGKLWDLKVEGPLVALRIGDHTFKMESDSALAIGGWLRLEARKAKHWAGDRGKAMRAFGILADAEENYRLGIS